MFRKLSYIIGVIFLLTSLPKTGFSQETEKTEEHHTGVKRTYNKVKHKVKRAWKKTKSTTAKEYNKAKNRVSSDDDKRDQQERK
jgi:hypothetical protein